MIVDLVIEEIRREEGQFFDWRCSMKRGGSLICGFWILALFSDDMTKDRVSGRWDD